MIELFTRLFQHLLPTGRAWRMVVDKFLRRFFQGLTGLGSDFKEFVDAIILDLFAQDTRQLDLWESQFGLFQTSGNTEQQRRDRIAAAWLGIGGQSPRYLQDTLQAAGFDVYIHEFWEPASSWPNGPAVVRNPNLYLVDNDGEVIYVAECNEVGIECGEVLAECGATVTPAGYPLVNKYTQTLISGVDCGEPGAECGEVLAECGEIFGVEFAPASYKLPDDPDKYPFFVYFGAPVFGDLATVQSSRKNEFETLLLRICPTQLWIGVLVNYT